jgi:hypothetical protein
VNVELVLALVDAVDGHTSTQLLSLTLMQASVMTYGMAGASGGRVAGRKDRRARGGRAVGRRPRAFRRPSRRNAGGCPAVRVFVG